MARAKKLRCETRYGSFGFGGLSPIKQCTKPAVERWHWTVKGGELAGAQMSELHCSAHRELEPDRKIKLGYLDSVEVL